MEKTKVKCCFRIKQALTEKGMSQKELASITGLTESSISHWVAGRYEPRQDAIYLISKALDVSEAWLMGYDVPKTRAEKIKTAVTPEEKNLLDLYAKLPTEKKTELIKYLEYITSTQN